MKRHLGTAQRAATALRADATEAAERCDVKERSDAHDELVRQLLKRHLGGIGVAPWAEAAEQTARLLRERVVTHDVKAIDGSNRPEDLVHLVARWVSILDMDAKQCVEDDAQLCPIEIVEAVRLDGFKPAALPDDRFVQVLVTSHTCR